MKAVFHGIKIVCERNVPRGKAASSPAIMGEAFRKIFDAVPTEQEHVMAIFVDPNNRILGHFHVSSGGQDQSIVDLRILMRAALLTEGPVSGIALGA
jgi:DNA repair protein RadC